jgi:hypothetical protein
LRFGARARMPPGDRFRLVPRNASLRGFPAEDVDDLVGGGEIEIERRLARRAAYSTTRSGAGPDGGYRAN